MMQYEGRSEDDLLVIVSADGCEVTDSAVSQSLKEAFLALRQVAESGE